MRSSKNIQDRSRTGTLHSEGSLLLMAIPILIIVGFQLYWLSENYKKEKRNLEFQTNVAFRETVRKLQAKKLKLDKFFNDSTGKIRMEVSNGGPFPGAAPFEGDEMTGLLNDITIRVNDSLSKKNNAFHTGEKVAHILKENEQQGSDSIYIQPGKKTNMVISVTNSNLMMHDDSAKEIKLERRGASGEFFRFLYNVDSLQDSLRIPEIDSSYRASLDKLGMNISFSVSRTDSLPQRRMMSGERTESNKITIGFAHPLTYEMNLGNSFFYLIKKLISPILFSFFLVGVTILSFVLMYRSLQKQRRLAEIKNEFISNITHELKTPIATVGVAIEALRNFNAINDPQRTKEYLDISQNELHRLSLLVDKVLKLSMFENKEVELKYESVNLKEIVEEVVSSMKLQIEKNHAAVLVNQEGDSSLQGDRLHLLSVVFNLLDNALKYGNGNTAIKIEMKEKGNDVELSIADNGIGIDPAYKDKVFEKFFRVPAGDTHNTKGYGLGLSYVAHVIRKHNGTIEVESKPGLGSKFIIVLPKNV